MTQSFFASALVGALQLAVPSYGLRLNRLFGSRQVGWALVAAFMGLALLNLASGLGPASARQEWELARSVVGAIIPALLLIGMAHVGTVLRERARVESDQTLRYCELRRFLDQRTEELAEAKEEFHRELTRRDEEQRTFAECAQQARLELATQVSARAGQRLSRHLAVIELYARLLLAKDCKSGTTEYYERLTAGAAGVRALARRLLASGGCHPLRTQLLSLSDVVRRQVPRLRNVLGADRRLECACAADAPLVRADPQIVRWMLEELAGNAREAMPEGGRLSITVERAHLSQPSSGAGARAGHFVAVVITDTGRGMGREVQRHLGEPFFTTDPASRTGLGLASVSGFLRAHGGWLAVISAPGHGTKVSLFFPAAGARSTCAQRSAPPLTASELR